jgi:hypothetical protein
MKASFRTVENWADYTFGWPDGKWTATLDNKAWARAGYKTSSCIFRKLGPIKKYWFSVFWANSYRADDKGLSFKDDVEPGAVLELATTKRRAGNPRLKAAAKLSA